VVELLGEMGLDDEVEVVVQVVGDVEVVEAAQTAKSQSILLAHCQWVLKLPQMSLSATWSILTPSRVTPLQMLSIHPATVRMTHLLRRLYRPSQIPIMGHSHRPKRHKTSCLLQILFWLQAAAAVAAAAPAASVTKNSPLPIQMEVIHQR
jgi:hypothetical protein